MEAHQHIPDNPSEHVGPHEAITARIEAAREHGTEIPRETARLIAAQLITASKETKPALKAFADDNTIDMPAMRAEYMALYESPETTAATREWICWLGTHLVQADLANTEHTHEERTGEPDHLTVIENTADGGFAANVLSTDSHEAIEAGLRKARELINFHGQAFKAYLMLPDVHATEPQLEENFDDVYVASYPDMDKVIEALTEVTDWEEQLRRFAAEHGIEELVSLDREQLKRIVRNTWDIVQLEGLFHVFDK